MLSSWRVRVRAGRRFMADWPRRGMRLILYPLLKQVNYGKGAALI
jgi:hypothetical protein